MLRSSDSGQGRSAKLGRMSSNKIPPDLLKRFIDEWSLGDDPRFNEVMASLLTHLHDFIWETQLSDEEWLTALQFLTQTGKLCDGWRDEFQLLSDVLGATTSINEINHDVASGLTDAAVLGPFYAEGSKEIKSGDSIVGQEMEGGESALVFGKVLDDKGIPVSGALLDIWQVAPNQMYAIQDEGQENLNLRARLYSEEDGSYSFLTYKPPPYPIPRDGTVGQLLDIGKRHGMRPAHIHFIVTAPGHERVITQLFTDDDRYLWSDAVFGEKGSLLVSYARNENPELAVEWILDYDFKLEKSPS
jgi:hydroxyquinol 1,2-dioxygenase